MNVTIYSVWSKREATQAAPRYTVEVADTNSNINAMEEAFEITNRPDRPNGQSVCSTSPGDVMEVNGMFYLVAGEGYQALTNEEARIIIHQLRSRDTSAGLEWLRKYDLVPDPNPAKAEAPALPPAHQFRPTRRVALTKEWSDFKRGQHFVVVQEIPCNPVIVDGGKEVTPVNLRVVEDRDGIDPLDAFYHRTLPAEYTCDIPNVGECDTINANQGDRDATCLAVVGTQALYEYEMPAGRCFLRLIDHDTGNWRAISRNNIPKAFQAALKEEAVA